LQRAEKYPKRFAGYATLPWQDPEAATREAERAVKELGMKAIMLQQATSDGTFYDEQKYWVIYEMAEKLDVPVFIHPGAMPPDMAKYYDYYPVVAGAMWGFAASAGLHGVRLIVSGVFDKYPGFKLILGHMGEGIPYWLWRMDSRSDGFPAIHKPSYYVKNNFFVNTSGMFWTPAIEFACRVLGSDKVLFAVDYPSESNSDAVQSIKDLSLTNSEKEKIFHVNAENIFRL
jgi:2,3-dihydroxybenzoate decarboxylase